MALQLAENCRRGERGKLQAATRIEPPDRQQEPDERDLLEVLDRLASADEAIGNGIREPTVAAKELSFDLGIIDGGRQGACRELRFVDGDDDSLQRRLSLHDRRSSFVPPNSTMTAGGALAHHALT
jgi:hypothetical protein